MRRVLAVSLSLALVLAAAGCGDDDEGCTLGTNKGCDDGLVCAEVQDGEPACFTPVEVHGQIFDALSEEGIAGATIVGLDANGGARTEVVRSGAGGSYSLPVSLVRQPDGTPVVEMITLRVAAADYQSFPTPPRSALPIDLAEAQRAEAGAPWVVENPATNVALLPLPAEQTGGITISGEVAHPDGDGVLVVATQGGVAVSSAVSDSDGEFILFNVPAGQTSVEGYRAGLAVTAEVVTAGSAPVADVVLEASTAGLVTVSGSVNIVNAPGGSLTSVLLVLESTFDEGFVRGESPAGLRVGEVSGAFSIPQVPAGRYVVLAAFENDGLVRDPDESIGGTDIVHIEVIAGSGEHVLDSSFKVTGALAVVSPGGEGLEVISASAPTLSWADDSSEDGYLLQLYNAYGELVFEDAEVPSVSGSATVTYSLSAGEIEPLMIYQFRVKSWRDGKDGRVYISASEDLRGVFQVVPAAN